MQLPTQLRAAEFTTVVYAHTPEFGVTLKDVLKPEYWTHVTRVMKPGYRIEVTSPELSYWADLLVLAVGPHEARVAVLNEVDLTKGSGEKLPDIEVTHKTKWRGPARKWGVIRISDDELIKDGFQDESTAKKWLAQHIRTVGATKPAVESV